MKKKLNNSLIKGAVLVKKKKLNIYSKIKFKKIEKKQVLVKIYYSGLCGSQIFEIEGKRGKDKYLPHLIGHEGTGKVIKIGKNVKNVKVGDQVFLSWIKTNESDSVTPNYTYKNKKINAGRITTLSTYSIISSNRVFKLPSKVSLKKGVLLGCAFPTGAGMVLKNLKKKNDRLLIIGLGGVGISSLLTSIFKKIKKIDILEKNYERIEFIKKKISYKNINFLNSINKVNPDTYDLIVESSGNAKMISLAVNFLKKKGKLVFASHPEKNSKLEIDPYDLIVGKKVFGTWGGGINLKKDTNKLIKIINAFSNIEKIFFNQSYKLENINSVIRLFKNGKIVRPLIKMN